MRVIGFAISEIHAKKVVDLKRPVVNTDIMFQDVSKISLDMLKDGEGLKATFKFTVSYKEPSSKDVAPNDVVFIGHLILSVSKDESKEYLKSWKNKELPKDKVVLLYNYILKKCSVRALTLEEELNLPLHIPFPQIKHNQ
jgi:hypothetical protein